MKNIVLGLSLLLLSSCTSGDKKVAMENSVPVDKIGEVVDHNIHESLNELQGYFTTLKPSEPTVLIINDRSEFDSKFHPARTMTNKVFPVNFETMSVGAIILPETDYETKVIIDDTHVSGNKLHISFHTEKGKEKLSYTSIPQYAFSFDKAIQADSVHFKGDNLSVYLPK